jgi:hypothetical protein
MDMNVSPDLPAYYCYLLVLLLGLWTAGTQVSARLANLPGKWIMVNTWFLFFAYTAIPVGLYWLLDRTNAIHDTSLFAAILIGVGYQQILSGSLSSIKVPGDVSSFLKPFAAWADAIAARIRDRIAINDSQFDEKLLSAIVEDPAKFEALKKVVMVHAADAAVLAASLTEIASKQDALGAAGVYTKQAALLYMTLKQASPRQFQFLLYRSGVISWPSYYWYAEEWRSKVTAIVVAMVLLTTAGTCALELSTPANEANYFVWRLHKGNATDIDLFRAKTMLVQFLATDPTVYSKLTGLLLTPNLPVKTADSILSLLVETRESAQKQKAHLGSLLVESLRTENSDIRERIQKTLVYLATDQHMTVPPDLQNWSADPKNTAADIDKIVKEWQTVGP